MSNKLILILSLCILFSCLLQTKFSPVKVKAPITYSVHNLDTGLNYTTIQEAIYAPETMDGHTISVDVGHYYEQAVVSKAVTLIGENRTTTIDGSGTGYGIHVIANNVSISNFTIRSCIYGIALENVSRCSIKGNLVTECQWGVLLFNSGGNTLRSNNMTGNDYNFGVGGSPSVQTSEMINDVDTSNIVDSKAIYYLVNQHDIVMDESAYPSVGYVAIINSTNITVKNLNLTHNRHGVLFFNVSDSTVEDINSHDNNRGMTFNACSNCTIARNMVAVDATSSIEIFYSNNITAYENAIINSAEGFMLYSSENVILNRNTVSSTTYSTNLLYSNNSIIRANALADDSYGITMGYSHNNTIIENNIAQNDYGIAFLYPTSNNTIYHNDFVENNQQVYTGVSMNVWDNGFEGNYWSDYTGVDLNHDGIGDGWHIIDENNADHFPLMGIFSDFSVTSAHSVQTICNSTISDFQFDGSAIYFNVTGMDGKVGFCRVCIPKSLIAPPYKVIINGGATEVLYFNDTIYDNGTHRWIYFAYEHSIHEIVIVPESPPFLILPIFVVATLLAIIVLAVIVYRRKHCV